MELSRLISLIIAGLYMVVFICALVAEVGEDGLSAPDIFETTFGVVVWLALGLGCIWWGDELGQGLTGARYGLISQPSPGWAVRMMGWVFLLLPVVIGIYYLISSH